MLLLAVYCLFVGSPFRYASIKGVKWGITWGSILGSNLSILEALDPTVLQHAVDGDAVHPEQIL